MVEGGQDLMWSCIWGVDGMLDWVRMHLDRGIGCNGLLVVVFV
jgi:hypothetical protein